MFGETLGGSGMGGRGTDIATSMLGWLVVLVPATVVAAVLVFLLWMRSYTLGITGAVAYGVALVAWGVWQAVRQRRQ